jgi:hypothetical protein
MGFSPPQAFGTAFIDFWNVTAAYKNGGISPTQYMKAAKRSHDTMQAVLDMTFWSMINEVKETIPDDVFNAAVRQMSDELHEIDGLTPEDRFQKMVQLIENTMTEIQFPNQGEQ